MSLLLDALKKAELAKQRQQQGLAPETSAAAAEPPAAEFPSLSLQLEEPPPDAQVPLPDELPAAALAVPQTPSELVLEPVATTAPAEPESHAFAADVPASEPSGEATAKPAGAAPVVDVAEPVPPATITAAAEVAAAKPARAAASNSPLAARFGAGVAAKPVQPAEPAPGPGSGDAGHSTSQQAEPQLATSAPAAKPSPEAARRVMASKQKQRKPLNRTLVLAIGGTLLVAGMAGYLWWQMQPPDFSTPPPAADGAGAGGAAAPADSAAAAAPAAPASTGAPVAAASAAPNKPGSAAAHPPPGERKATRNVAAAAPGSSGADRAAPVPDSRLQIVRDAPQETIDEGVRAGYQAFANGDLAAARAAYTKALQNDARSRDALLGLAAVAARQGRPEEAERWYRKQLEIDPLDQLAQAGLTAVSRALGPRERETALRNLGEQQAGMPQTAAQLGNLYAAEKRWNEAQQQFFRAYSLEPGNPDHAFNLAVSLEHLDQPKLALDYYNKAQQLSGQRKPGFDPAELKARIEALSQP